jgi:hypothetical protein
MAARTDRALESVAHRQARRRAFNEQLDHLGGEPPLYRCECGLIACDAVIRMEHFEYAALRAEARHFAMLSGHVIPEAEQVVASHGVWVTAEKPLGAQTLVAPFDPDAQSFGFNRARRSSNRS